MDVSVASEGATLPEMSGYGMVVMSYISKVVG